MTTVVYESFIVDYDLKCPKHGIIGPAPHGNIMSTEALCPLCTNEAFKALGVHELELVPRKKRNGR